MASEQTETAVAAPLPENGVPAAPTVAYSYRDFKPTVKLHYIRDYDEANVAVEKLQPGAYGFDLEWKPTFVKGQSENRTALVQLANDKDILLIQVSALKSFPENLKAFLENPDYIKAGAGIQNDSKKLHADYGVEMKSCVDLSLLARSVDNQWKGKYTNPLGLARLIATYDNLALGKGRISRSNWEAELDQKQQEYASNDAHAGFRLYSRLINMGSSMDEAPDVACYSYGIVRGMLCLPTGYLWHPKNSNYDPGPPPPKLPKEDKSGKRKGRFNSDAASAAALEASTTVQLSSSSGSAFTHHQQTRRRYHHSGDGDYRGAPMDRAKRPRVGNAVNANTSIGGDS